MSATPGRWRELEALYQAAMERAPSERAAFLNEACQDEDLRREVQSLLSYSQPGDALLEGGAARLAMAPLRAGSTLGVYCVVDRIGAGGMGEVYRASDTRLHRDVAIKLLPPVFAGDREWRARFEREARLLASLNHPHIASIYGLEESGSAPALVMELVEGDTLAERIARGRIPRDELLSILLQICQALEYAHGKGIVHRDLKPANIKIAPDGRAKVLDFGLAKMTRPSTESLAAGSETVGANSIATRPGYILGSAPYMSPEQARGKKVDRQTDIWAFGCVLYECLSGKQAFGGDSAADSIAAVVRAEPDWSKLPMSMPPRLLELVRRCLRKDPNQRLHDIADARLELEELLQSAAPGASGDASAPAFATPRHRWIAVSVVAALLLVAFLIWQILPGVGRMTWRTPPPVRPVMRLMVPLPNAALQPGMTFSPDGARLAYAGELDGRREIFVRAFDQLEPAAVPGTEGGSSPFFSSDGKWLGFFADGKLKKIALAGGQAVPIADVPDARGAAWGADDQIILGTTYLRGILRVSSTGGPLQPITSPDQKRNEISHRWPRLLPGGQTVLFTIMNSDAMGLRGFAIAALSLKTGEQRTIIEAGAAAQYVSTPSSGGYLVYAVPEGLMAAPFDPAHVQLAGPARLLQEAFLLSGKDRMQFQAEFALSPSGELAYLPAGDRQDLRAFVWVRRKGQIETIAAPPRRYGRPRLSPDGTKMTVAVEDATSDIWVYDLLRGTLSRLTFDGLKTYPLWTPDGKRITFSSSTTPSDVFWAPADGSGQVQSLDCKREALQSLDSWSPDGKFLVMSKRPAKTELWIYSMADRRARLFLDTPFSNGHGSVSPDGKWLAYDSLESGRNEVYVQAFPNPGAKSQVSTQGGYWPRWTKNGYELCYESGGSMISVEVQAGDSFRAGVPTPLFELPAGVSFNSGWDATPDGQKFLMLREVPPQSRPGSAVLLLNWSEK